LPLIQPLLIGGFIIAFFGYLRFMRSQLRDRLAATFLFLISCGAVLVPHITQRIADFVGVGRGTDLTFYLFAAAFIFFAVLVYSKLNRHTFAVTAVVRQIAINEAVARAAACEMENHSS